MITFKKITNTAIVTGKCIVTKQDSVETTIFKYDYNDKNTNPDNPNDPNNPNNPSNPDDPNNPNNSTNAKISIEILVFLLYN